MNHKNPYYIVASISKSKSAGDELMYILGKRLIQKRYEVYAILEGELCNCYTYNPIKYKVPVLSIQQALLHIKYGFKPILIRTEGGGGNINNLCTFRYLLNYIGHFPGEPKETDPEFQIDKKYFWAFSKDIAQKHNVWLDRVIFTPIIDTEVFYLPKAENRKGTACYLGKYAEIYSQNIPTEIKQLENCYIFYRSGKRNVPTRIEYAEKLRTSECLYVYENTSVITEALMCGCPVVCVPNPYCSFSDKDMIGFYEIGLNGIAIGTSDEEIERAKATVHLAREKILQLMQEFDKKVDYFIEETQRISHETTIDVEKAKISLENYFNKQLQQKQNKFKREIKRAFENIITIYFIQSGYKKVIKFLKKS